MDRLYKKPFSLPFFSVSFLLALQAGAINAGGVMSCHRYVTHSTGFITHIGMEMAYKNFGFALSLASVPLVYLVGAALSGYMVDARKERGQRPLYRYVLGLIWLVLCVVFLGGIGDYFGVFGEPLALTRDYVLLGLLSFASGLQNAVITSASGSVVRTTHLTGLCTDLGIGIARIISNSHLSAERRSLHLSNALRLGIMTSFCLGAFIGTLAYMRFEYAGFIVPLTTASILYFHSLLNQYREDKQLAT